ncbi:MAG TPA: hypothetical protein PLD25_11220 [Chloroflexota bacterium]|nr:hypothetical protein [Chloroflexota bacterium]
MFESNPYAMVGVAMIGELHRVVSEKAEAAEQSERQPRLTWRYRLSRIVVNLWSGRESYHDECDQAEMGCI